MLRDARCGSVRRITRIMCSISRRVARKKRETMDEISRGTPRSAQQPGLTRRDVVRGTAGLASSPAGPAVVSAEQASAQATPTARPKQMTTLSAEILRAFETDVETALQTFQ